MAASPSDAPPLPEFHSSLPIGTQCKIFFHSKMPQPIRPSDIEPELGGRYATAKQGPEKPIEVAPLTPGSLDQQTWRFELDSDGLHRIQFVDHNSRDLGSQLGFYNELDPSQGIPIKLSSPSKYYVRELGKTPSGHTVVFIQPNDTYGHHFMTQLDYLTVSHTNNTIEVERIDDVRGIKPPLPVWLVIRAE